MRVPSARWERALYSRSRSWGWQGRRPRRRRRTGASRSRPQGPGHVQRAGQGRGSEQRGPEPARLPRAEGRRGRAEGGGRRRVDAGQRHVRAVPDAGAVPRALRPDRRLGQGRQAVAEVRGPEGHRRRGAQPLPDGDGHRGAGRGRVRHAVARVHEGRPDVPGPGADGHRAGRRRGEHPGGLRSREPEAHDGAEGRDPAARGLRQRAAVLEVLRADLRGLPGGLPDAAAEVRRQDAPVLAVRLHAAAVPLGL